MFSKRINLAKEPNRLSQIIKTQKKQGRHIFDLTQSNPTKVGLVYDRKCILAVLSQPEGLTYDPDPCGLKVTRNVICDYYQTIDAHADSDSIYVTAGTSEAYAVLFKLLGDPCDQILIPSPGYPLLFYLARFESLDPAFYPLRYDSKRGWYLDFDAIEARISSKTRAIVVVNPNNPTGVYLKQHELLTLDQICRKNDMALIVDEVFSDFYDDSLSIKIVRTAVDKCKALTFVLNGFSKMVALPQVKLGWIVVSGEEKQVDVAKERLEMLLDFYLLVSSQAQHAAKGLLALKRDLQNQIKHRIACNQKELNHQLAKTSNCRMLIREGGWYAVVEIEDLWEEEASVIQLLSEDNTLVHPGYFYDFQREGFMVVSLLPDSRQFKQGIDNLTKRFGRKMVKLSP
jgi:alanine-synthesizing transaminase